MSVSAMQTMKVLKISPPEILEIKAVTLSLSLLEYSGKLPHTIRSRSYDKIRRIGGNFVTASTDVARKLGIVSDYHHVNTTPVSSTMDDGSTSDFLALAEILDTAAADIGVDSISGFAAVVDMRTTSGDRALLESLTDALPGTSRLYATLVTSSRAGVSSEAFEIVNRVRDGLFENEKTRECLTRLSVVGRPYIWTLPYYAGYQHIGADGGASYINISIAGADSILGSIERLGIKPKYDEIDAAVKSVVTKLIRGSELFAWQTAERLSHLCGHEVFVGTITLAFEAKLRDHKRWPQINSLINEMKSFFIESDSWRA